MSTHDEPASGPAASTASGSAPAGLLQGRFEGRLAFQQAVREGLAAAAREGWRELILSDASFEDWPLGERETEALLQAWAQGGRRLVLLARHYDEVARRHARFVAWRRQWDHVIEARTCRGADPLDLPSAFWSPAWCLHRLDPERSTGVAGSEPQRRLALREQLDAWLHKSAPGFAASTLGL